MQHAKPEASHALFDSNLPQVDKCPEAQAECHNDGLHQLEDFLNSTPLQAHKQDPDLIRNDISSEYVASTTSTFGSNDDSPKLDTAEHQTVFEVPEESNYLDLLPGLLDVESAPLAQTEDVNPASNKNGQTIGKLTPEERKAKIARYLKKKEAR